MEKPPQDPAPLPAPRDDVRVATSRCPYCHEAVRRDAEAWVSCRECLARHHAACWEEAHACSACGETRYLAEQGPAQAPRVAPPATQIAWRLPLFGALVLVTILGAALSDTGQGHDDALAWALAATGGVGALLTALGRQPLTILGGSITTLGLGFAFAANSIDGWGDMAAAAAAGALFILLGLLTLALAYFRSRRD